MSVLLLYSTAGCHLCELAKDVIYPLLDEFDLQLAEQDIAEADELIEAYGVRIPVLLLSGGTQDLAWPFDTQQARQYLSTQLKSVD